MSRANPYAGLSLTELAGLLMMASQQLLIVSTREKAQKDVKAIMREFARRDKGGS